MSWTPINFSKYSGKTLPQILFSDPDWFFWNMEKEIPFNKDSLLREGEILIKRARNIKIRKNEEGNKRIEYYINPVTKKFSHFNVVIGENENLKDNPDCFYKKIIDLSAVRLIAHRDRKGNRAFVSLVKLHLFGDKNIVLTRKQCGEFFENEDNFL